MNYMSIIEFDNRRFDDLYQKYAGIVFRTAYNFLLNKDDAEDIVQEVFIKYFISNKTFNIAKESGPPETARTSLSPFCIKLFFIIVFMTFSFIKIVPFSKLYNYTYFY